MKCFGVWPRCYRKTGAQQEVGFEMGQVGSRDESKYNFFSFILHPIEMPQLKVKMCSHASK